MCRVTIAGLVIGLLTSLDAKADGLLARLPEDGAWVRYEALLSDGSRVSTGQVIIRSVGNATVNDKLCRWIEFQIESDQISFIAKLLITEEELQKSKEPDSQLLSNVVRVWFKPANG